MPGWSETVKRLWDEDGARRVPLKVVLLGSAPLLIQSGLGESLAGRFEILPLPHWSLARSDLGFRGRLVESAVGAHLANAAATGVCELFYWRDGDREVDFVVRAGRRVTAIEVKSGRRSGRLSGLEAFSAAFHPDRKLLVGADGIPLESFLERPVEHWVRR